MPPAQSPSGELGTRVARGATALLAGRVLRQLVGWGIEVALVRWLLPEQWDTLSRLLTVSLTVTVFGQIGLPESILYFSSRSESPARARGLVYRTLGLLIAIGLGLTALFAISRTMRERLLGFGDPTVLLPLAGVVAFGLASTALPPFWVATKRPRLAAIYGIVGRLPELAGIAVAVGMGAEVTGLVTGMAAGSAVSLALGLMWTVDRKEPVERPECSLREQLAFAVPAGLTRVVGTANTQLDKYVVMTLLVAVPYGTYYLGALEFPFVMMVAGVVSSVMMPDLVERAAEPSRRRFVELLHAANEKMALIALPCFFFLMAYAPDLFAWIYGPEHAQASIVFRVYQVLLLLRIINYTTVLQSLNRPRVPLVAAVIVLAINAPLSYVLAKALGMVGPALATVIAVYASAGYTLEALRRELQVGWGELFPWRAYGTMLAIAAVSLAPALAVAWPGAASPARLVCAAALYLGAFIGGGVVTGVVGRPELSYVRDVVTARFLKGTP